MTKVILLAVASVAFFSCSGDTESNNAESNNRANNTNNVANNTNNVVDTDGDGVSDDDELALGTDPNNPDTDGDGLSDGEEVRLGTDPLNVDSDGDGYLDGSEVVAGSNPNVVDEACGFARYEASLEEKPVDVIFVIDNSGSMTDEIQAVERNINTSFADIIRASGLDFRVIMVSEHGYSYQQAICVSTPLSGTTCDPMPPDPVNTMNFFHYDRAIGSRNSLRALMESYDGPNREGKYPDGWSVWLRDDAFKVIVEISDDAPTGDLPDRTNADAQGFDAYVLGLEPPQFGVPGKRNYIFHSIIGMQANGADAWQPTDPILNGKCPGGVDPAVEYQKLSIATGGLRYPVCNTDSYDVVFKAVAQGIIEQAKIGCEIALPEAPAGMVIVESNVVLEWTPTAGASAEQVTLSDVSSCGDRNFYIENATIKLCPELCGDVSVSTEGELNILAACGQPTEVCVPEGAFEVKCDDGKDNDCDGFIDRADIECLQ